jgi:hypothetical protein
MPGRIFFRDERATVTSTEVIIGKLAFPLSEILSARGVRRRSLWSLLQPSRFVLLITTAAGECEALRERNGFVVFKLAQAIEAALRERNKFGRSVKPPAQTSPLPPPSAETSAGLQL